MTSAIPTTAQHPASPDAPASHSGGLLLLVLAAHVLTALIVIREESHDQTPQTEPLTIALIAQGAESSPRELRGSSTPVSRTWRPAPVPPLPAPPATEPPVPLAQPPQAVPSERAAPLASALGQSAPGLPAPPDQEASPPVSAALPPAAIAPAAPTPAPRPLAQPTPALAMANSAAPAMRAEAQPPVRDPGAVVQPPRPSPPAGAPAQIPRAPQHPPGPLPPSAPTEDSVFLPPPERATQLAVAHSALPVVADTARDPHNAPAPVPASTVTPSLAPPQTEHSPRRQPLPLATGPIAARPPLESDTRALLASPTGSIVPRDTAASVPQAPPSERSTPPAPMGVAEGRPALSPPPRPNPASGPPVGPQRMADLRAAPLPASRPALAPRVLADAPPPPANAAPSNAADPSHRLGVVPEGGPRQILAVAQAPHQAPVRQAQAEGQYNLARPKELMPKIGVPAGPVSIAPLDRNPAPLPAPAVLSTPRLPAGAHVDATGDIVLGGDILRASYLSNPKPLYPSRSRRLGEQGVVTLRVLIDENGQPRRVLLKTSSGYQRLDNAAQQAVTAWKFTAILAGGRKAGAWVLVPIRFALR